MAEFIHEHSTRLKDEDGTAYVVRIYARENPLTTHDRSFSPGFQGRASFKLATSTNTSGRSFTDAHSV